MVWKKKKKIRTHIHIYQRKCENKYFIGKIKDMIAGVLVLPSLRIGTSLGLTGN